MDNYIKRGKCEVCGCQSNLNKEDTCKDCVEKYRSSLMYLYLYDMDGYITYLCKHNLINY